MTYRPYPAYKDSGIEWLGDASKGSVQGIPEHWGVCALKRIVTLKSGETINSECIEVDGMYPVYGGGGFRGYTDSYTHEGEYALIGRQGALCGNINYGKGKFWASEHAVVVSPIRDLEMHWIGELLRSMNLNQYSVSAAQPGLSVEAISNLLVPVPSFPEQQAIAAFLNRETTKIDGLVAEQERLIELLTEKRQAVISHAVTRGLDPSVPLKDSGVEWLGPVPENWEVKRLRMVADVQTGIAKGKNNEGQRIIETPYLRVANVQDGYLDLTEIGMIEIPENDLPRYLLQPGDVLMNEGGDFDKLGRGHIWRGEIFPCIHQNHVFAVRPYGILAEWLNAFTGSNFAQFYFKTRSKQSTNLASISSTNLMELPIPVPPTIEQSAISADISNRTTMIDNLVTESQRSIRLLKERRSALISTVVTGQINVSEISV